MGGSENVWSAENQQERLFTIAWLVGFVDGEGCFAAPSSGTARCVLDGRCNLRSPSFKVRRVAEVLEGDGRSSSVAVTCIVNSS